VITFIRSALALRPDLIYVVDVAYSGVLAGYWAKQLIRCKLVIDTGDVAYELAKSTGRYSTGQLKLIRWIEQLALHQSDHLVVRSSYHKTWLEQQGIQSVVFVPDGVDVSAARPVDASQIRRKLGLDHQLVVGLVGTMSWSERHQMCYGWDIIEALRLLPDRPVKALLIGDGNGRSILAQRAQEFGIADRVIFTGRVPYTELAEYLSAMDVCVSTQSNDLVGMVRTTGKLPLYLAYGKYVIATDVGEASHVLPQVGYLLPYGGIRDDSHPARLATHLSMLLDHPDRLSISVQARQVAEEQFDYRVLAQRIERMCQGLVNDSVVSSR
jgi:glycosyltransferase involved in cell wall biosynthesis